MKTVAVATLALLTLCSGHVIPSDNEGDGRYVLMSDANGKPVLVDLEEPVDEDLLKVQDGSNNMYWLFTRSNPYFAQALRHGDANSIYQSFYDSKKPLNIIVHGYIHEDFNSPHHPGLAFSALVAQDSNVIVVDWFRLASTNYPTAVAGAPSVGEHLGDFLTWLITLTGSDWNQVHLIGFGTGAHVAGIAGQQSGSRPSRITGLNPTGPLWNLDPNRLGPGKARYVEVIHTNTNVFGIQVPSGDVDFYPNGGRNQAGCFTTVCSHNRATDYFDATLRFPVYGYKCADFGQAILVGCDGEKFPMGNLDVNKNGSGLYGMRFTTLPF